MSIRQAVHRFWIGKWAAEVEDITSERLDTSGRGTLRQGEIYQIHNEAREVLAARRAMRRELGRRSYRRQGRAR